MDYSDPFGLCPCSEEDLEQVFQGVGQRVALWQPILEKLAGAWAALIGGAEGLGLFRWVGSAVIRPSTEEQLTGAAGRAAARVGPGRGPVYGTAVHRAFEGEVNALGRDDLASEVSYKGGRVVPQGTKGSIRADVVEGPLSNPRAIYELKTGDAVLSPARIAEIRSQLPGGGTGVPVIEIR